MKRILIIISTLFTAAAALAQENVHYQWLEQYARNIGESAPFCVNPRRVEVPDIPGYHTYKADLHMHTIYSDAQVTPQMRVYEAWMEDVDILAITDHHPEPRRQFGKKDMNAGYDEAAKYAGELGVRLIRGFELTGGEPVGHINVLFVKDCNDYRMKYGFTPADADSILVRARREGAFITANHPGWPDQNSTPSDFVAERMANGTFGAVEVFNHKEFYPLAIDQALQYNLAMFACTDSHYPTYYHFDQVGNHRDMTLIFARDDSDEGLKEALNAGRTIAWADNKLAGREDLLRTFLHACIKVVFVRESGNTVRFRLLNKSDIPFVLTSDDPQETVRIPANGYAETKRRKSGLLKNFKVENVYISSTERLEIPLEFLLQPEGDVCIPSIPDRSITFTDKGMSFRLVCDQGDTYYTLDGSEPDENATLYEGGAIETERPGVIKAVTIRDGKRSQVASKVLNFAMAARCKGRKHGVHYSYYEHPDLLSTTHMEQFGVLRKQGTRAYFDITEGEGQDHFGYIFTGVINAPVTGLYQFTLMSNDGSDLYIDGVPACDNDQHNGYHAESGTIYLQQGFHNYRIRYFEGYGMESFGIQWKKPGSASPETLPEDVLYLE